MEGFALLKVMHHFTTAYHQQGDGQSERTCKRLGKQVHDIYLSKCDSKSGREPYPGDPVYHPAPPID